MSSTLIGHSAPWDGGSYVTTEWFTILWLPIFPVCRYRVTEHPEASGPCYRLYTIHEKMPPLLPGVARVYGIMVLILLTIIGFASLILR